MFWKNMRRFGKPKTDPQLRLWDKYEPEFERQMADEPTVAVLLGELGKLDKTEAPDSEIGLSEAARSRQNRWMFVCGFAGVLVMGGVVTLLSHQADHQQTVAAAQETQPPELSDFNREAVMANAAVLRKLGICATELNEQLYQDQLQDSPRVSAARISADYLGIQTATNANLPCRTDVSPATQAEVTFPASAPDLPAPSTIVLRSQITDFFVEPCSNGSRILVSIAPGDGSTLGTGAPDC